MEEGDNDNEVKLIQSGGGAPEHNVQMSLLVLSLSHTHTPLYIFIHSLMQKRMHTLTCRNTHTFCLFSSVAHT